MRLYWKRTRSIGCLALLLWGTWQSMAAQHPNQPLGFNPERAYQNLGDLDRVDLFSGTLSLLIPIGPFSLHYNSNVWRYESVVEGQAVAIRATPDRQTTAGLGWHLAWGEVYSPDHWYNDTGRWLYVSDDGGRHVFYNTLHKGEIAASNILYTRDGTYLRMRRSSNFFVDIEFPNGTTRRFDSGTGGLESTYHLQKVWTPFGSAADPDITVTYDRLPSGGIIGNHRTLTDRWGRSHVVQLSQDLGQGPISWMNRVVTQIDVEGFGGQRVLYDLEYRETLINVSCKDTSASTPARITIPLLSAIHNRADGSSYRMLDGSALLYHTDCKNGVADVSGVLSGLNLPTGGKYRWTFQEYEFPPGDTSSVFNTSAGVATRRLFNRNNTSRGVWKYKTSWTNPGGGADPEVYTEVVYPPTAHAPGHCKKHYFNGRYWTTPSQNKGWEYGLPFISSQQDQGKFLSMQVWDDSNSGGSCSGRLKRSVYFRFRHDAIPGTAPSPSNGVTLADFYNTNRQLEASRIVYHDDNDRAQDTEFSQFDGLGHFRKIVATGNVWVGTPAHRERFVNYNRVSGTYPGSFVPPAPTTPWVLGVFDYVQVDDPDAFGEKTARKEFIFEDRTGYLECTRVLMQGTARGPHDLVTVFTRDFLGQTVEESRYGGDLQRLATTGSGCESPPAAPEYRVSHTYRNGVRITSQPLRPSGQPAPYLTYDVDIDPSTGLVVAQRDSSLLTTTYRYDALGRLTGIVPSVGAEASFAYTTPDPSSGLPASLRQSMATPLGAASGTALAERELIFDDFGRKHRERRRLPGGVWAEQETRYNDRGLISQISEWSEGPPSKWVQFLLYDPFDRPRRIRPPDGIDHDLLISYEGTRFIKTRAKIATAAGEVWASRLLDFDRFGRLRRLREAAGPDGALVGTQYLYDVNGNLTRINSPGTSQERVFAYDNRGFLLSERHPELGLGGNGLIQYAQQDSLGLAHQVIGDGRRLALDYDYQGRHTSVRDVLNSNRLVKEFAYDGAVGDGEGRLWYAVRHHYVDLPWNPQGEENVQVRQRFSYFQSGGAVSRKETAIDWSPGDVTFSQSYLYDDLGNVAMLKPANCAAGPCGGAQVRSWRRFAYEQGTLTGITGWVDQIRFHPSGLWKEIRHANGVVDHQTQDADFAQRPQRIFTSGALPAISNFDSGLMAYDGAGNLKSMGSDAFAYDKAGRLVSASMNAGKTDGAAIERDYFYDRFGNLTALVGEGMQTDFQVDSATNRATASGAAYDGSGNLTNWDGLVSTYGIDNRVLTQGGMRFLYDAFGERVASFPTAASTPLATFDMRDLDHRLQVRFRLEGSAYRRERDFVHAGNRLVGLDLNGSKFHYSLDHLGSPRIITNSGGSVVQSYTFAPFGQQVGPTGGADPFRFAGHERDFASGADYMHARHYLAQLGRFMSTDEAGGHPAVPQSLNRNAYVMGNPINLVDPDGLAGESSLNSGFPRMLYLAFKKSPPAVLEKAAVAGFVIPFAMTGALVGDASLAVVRIIPPVDERLDQRFGETLFPLTTELVKNGKRILKLAIFGSEFRVPPPPSRTMVPLPDPSQRERDRIERGGIDDDPLCFRRPCDDQVRRLRDGGLCIGEECFSRATLTRESDAPRVQEFRARLFFLGQRRFRCMTQPILCTGGGRFGFLGPQLGGGSGVFGTRGGPPAR